MDERRTTAMGLWTDAQEMLGAARVVSVAQGQRVSRPAYYWTGHGLEEALKAFLLVRGCSLQRLKQIGHDLDRALRAANEDGLGQYCVLDASETAMIRLLNCSYHAKELEYRSTGFVRYPELQPLITLVDRLLVSIKPLCWASLGCQTCP